MWEVSVKWMDRWLTKGENITLRSEQNQKKTRGKCFESQFPCLHRPYRVWEVSLTLLAAHRRVSRTCPRSAGGQGPALGQQALVVCSLQVHEAFGTVGTFQERLQLLGAVSVPEDEEGCSYSQHQRQHQSRDHQRMLPRLCRGKQNVNLNYPLLLKHFKCLLSVVKCLTSFVKAVFKVTEKQYLVLRGCSQLRWTC